MRDVIDRLNDVEITYGSSHDNLNRICKAVYPVAGPWTRESCEGLRDRLVDLLGGERPAGGRGDRDEAEGFARRVEEAVQKEEDVTLFGVDYTPRDLVRDAGNDFIVTETYKELRRALGRAKHLRDRLAAHARTLEQVETERDGLRDEAKVLEVATRRDADAIESLTSSLREAEAERDGLVDLIRDAAADYRALLCGTDTAEAEVRSRTMASVEVLRHPTDADWRRCKALAMATVGKEWDGEVTEEWKCRMLRAGHSPVRTLMFTVRMEVPYWVSVHLCRHKHGVEHYVRTQRNDRQDRYDRAEAPQGALVTHVMDLNAQALVQIARMRLCGQAAPETREAVRDVCRAVIATNPEFKPLLRPKCLSEGGTGWCNEFRPCGDAGRFLP